MPIFDRGHTYVDGENATEAIFNGPWDALEAFLNVTKLGADNIQDGVLGNADLAAAANIALSKLAIVPAARVYNSANQDFPNFTENTLSFNSERFDTDTIHDPAVNPSRLTCKTAGLYQITADVQLWGAGDSDATDTFPYSLIRLNGTTLISSVAGHAMDSGDNPHRWMNLSTLWKMAVNDYVEVRVHSRQNNAGGSQFRVNYAECAMAYLGRLT